MTAPSPACSAIVLAGGRATRLDGADKALVPLAGKPLLAHVLERLAPQVDDIVINYNRAPAALAGFGHPVVGDAGEAFAGPLAGIAAALPHCRHDIVLVVPCDSPFLPRDLQARLAAALTADHALAIAHDGERLQPLFLLLRRERLPALAAWLQNGGRKVESWCLAQNPAIVRIIDDNAFSNLNTAEEIAAAEKILEGEKPPLSSQENG
ncbi:MAG: molybdenum cofactor guanylyltransferase MobA [Moraxellaceae bacterium]|jgi:molybdopterin-guanine dinucleotide biosynthesis protein A|nr:molybdenum cofactor guanylyltransferase MobA [Moraxellaceae bacterium]